MTFCVSRFGDDKPGTHARGVVSLLGAHAFTRLDEQPKQVARPKFRLLGDTAIATSGSGSDGEAGSVHSDSTGVAESSIGGSSGVGGGMHEQQHAVEGVSVEDAAVLAKVGAKVMLVVSATTVLLFELPGLAELDRLVRHLEGLVPHASGKHEQQA